VERAITTYEKKYKMKLDRKVQVEVYPDHEDFAYARWACRAWARWRDLWYSIAMDSPSGRTPANFIGRPRCGMR